MSDYLPSFKKNLEVEGKNALTIKSYLSDMRHFRRWFEQTTGVSFPLEVITALGIDVYKTHLVR